MHKSPWVNNEAGSILRALKGSKEKHTPDPAEDVLISLGYIAANTEARTFVVEDGKQDRSLFIEILKESDGKDDFTLYGITEGGDEDVFLTCVYDDGEIINVVFKRGGWEDTLELWYDMVKDGLVVKLPASKEVVA